MCFGLDFVSRTRDKIKSPIAKIFTPWIQYDLEATDFVGEVQKDSSSHFMYSLALDLFESVPINLVISFDISNSMAGQRKVVFNHQKFYLAMSPRHLTK